MKNYLLTFLFLVVLSGLVAQIPRLEINDTKSVQELVKQLERKGDVISNITFNIPNDPSGANPVGEYRDGLGFLGLNRGLLITNGSAVGALGPNDNKNEQQDNLGVGTSGTNDPDMLDFLETMVAQNSTSKPTSAGSGAIFDYVIIEFDIKTTNDNISYNYVFGSEEYPFPNPFSKSDGFGCYVSGPDIIGSKNIALLPNGNVISIVTLNETVNQGFYNGNGVGETPLLNFYHQYDGFSTKLTARTSVIPCETYHVKFFIIDHEWADCDSGAFIESSDLEDEDLPQITIEFENPSLDFLVEGCNDAVLTTSIPTTLNPSNYALEIGGNATQIIDFNSGELLLTFSEFVTQDSLKAILDNLKEGTERIEFYLKNTCLDLYLDTLIVDLKDEVEYELGPLVKCVEDSLELNPDFIPETDSLRWVADPTLSCTICGNPKSIAQDSISYFYQYIDKLSGCEVDDTLDLTVRNPQAFFIYDTKQDYTSLDAFFDNESKNSQFYMWDFGDGSSSTDFEPEHSYPITNGKEPETFVISLIVEDDLGCKAQYDTTIVIAEPFSIPNIFTPNKDAVNDFFVVQGIMSNRWKLEIFNRWGELIFTDDKYSNDWSAVGLSDGVYYYQLTNPDERRIFKGWVTIIR